MTREEAIHILDNLKPTTTKSSFDAYVVGKAITMAIKALEQEPCEDEYIKVPKKALKYRTAGMVAYNVEWLKNHFDIERAVICGAQEPKTGHWERISNDITLIQHDTSYYKCSECREKVIGNHNYCPFCGAKMVEPQESEIHCNHTDAEIAKSFIEDVEAVKDLLPQKSDHKCHTCKHYTSGENDGSCGSYICKNYSDWDTAERSDTEC